MVMPLSSDIVYYDIPQNLKLTSLYYFPGVPLDQFWWHPGLAPGEK